MDDKLKTQLSALVDDELHADEMRFVVARTTRDALLRTQLGRYFLIRDSLRDSQPVATAGLAARVSVALDDEQAHEAEGMSAAVTRRVTRPAAGLAIAASVALVTLGLWPSPDVDPTSAPVATTASNTTAVADSATQFAQGQSTQAAASLAVSDDQAWDHLDPAVQQRMNSYLVNHSEHSSTGRFGGVLTYVRIAGHEDSR